MHALFDDLQFRVLRERLFATVEAAEPEADEGFDVTATRLGVDEVEQWLDRARARRATGSGWPSAGSGAAAPGR